MYRVCFPKTVVIQGCPKAGLAAIDFRRQAGLPAAPSNEIDAADIEGLSLAAQGEPAGWIESEAICREFADQLDGNADLHLTPSYYWNSRLPVVLPPAAILAIHGAGLIAKDALFSALSNGRGPSLLIDAIRELFKDRAAKDNAKAAEERERNERIEAEKAAAKQEYDRMQAVRAQLKSPKWEIAPTWSEGESWGKKCHNRATLLGFVSHPWESERVYFSGPADAAEASLAAGIPSSEAVLEENQVEVGEAWLREHGSARAKKLLAEFPNKRLDEVYIAERLAAEWSGWSHEVPEQDGYRIRLLDPHLPPEEALDVLAAARTEHADIEPAVFRLRFVQGTPVDEDGDDESDTDPLKGYVVKCTPRWLLEAIDPDEPAHLYLIDRIVLADSDGEWTIEDWS